MSEGAATAPARDRRAWLSTLWVVVMFNMVCADILAFEVPGFLQKLWAGQQGVHITPGLLLVFAILLEVPIAMIFLSRVLKPAAGRWANSAAAAVTTAFVIGGGSLSPHGVFFASVEVACMALIVWTVWSRRGREADRRGTSHGLQQAPDSLVQ